MEVGYSSINKCDISIWDLKSFWYNRMIILFQIGGGQNGSTTSPPVIGSVAAADSCMLALDYAQNKVGYFSKILWFAHIFM